MAGSGTFEAILGDHAEAAVELGSTAALRVPHWPERRPPC